MNATEVKAEMIAILGGGANWCKGSNARKSDDTPCPIMGVDAAKWDVFGALVKATHNEPDFKVYHEVYDDMRTRVPSTYKNNDIESYNDDTDFSGILVLIGA